MVTSPGATKVSSPELVPLFSFIIKLMMYSIVVGRMANERERRTPLSGRGRVEGVTMRQRGVRRWGAGVVLEFGDLGGTVRRQGTDKMDAGGGKGQ